MSARNIWETMFEYVRTLSTRDSKICPVTTLVSIIIVLGSDLAGETAAALAATSIVFRSHDPDYSDKCLKHAKELYKFANRYRGLYNEAIPGAALYYESTDYGDELAWAALWLFKATNNTMYFEEAEHHYQHFHLKERPNEFFYNKKVAGVQVIRNDGKEKRTRSFLVNFNSPFVRPSISFIFAYKC